jgi:hypothetical protein
VRRPLPIEHPVAVLAVLLLALNDHVLKRVCPGFVTGKLSDVAGMVFFPLLLSSLVSYLLPSYLLPRRGERTLAVACIATAVVFALVKTAPWANDAYRITWGVMHWPLRVLSAWCAGHATPGPSRALLVRDPGDLIALPFVLAAWRIGRATLARRPAMSRPYKDAKKIVPAA